MMVIELANEQSESIRETGEGVMVIDRRTNRVYHLVNEDLFRRLQTLLSEGSPWTAEETALLAGEAFSKLDNTDYSDYLREGP